MLPQLLEEGNRTGLERKACLSQGNECSSRHQLPSSRHSGAEES